MIDFARPEFRREQCVMLNSALETPIFLDRSRQFWAANRRQGPFDLVTAALRSGMGAMPISGRRSRGEDGRPLRLRTPAIRRNRPTVQGPPAFSPAQCPRAGGRPILPQRTSGVMLKTTRVRASIWSRTLFQTAVFKLSQELVSGSADLSLEGTGEIAGTRGREDASQLPLQCPTLG